LAVELLWLSTDFLVGVVAGAFLFPKISDFPADLDFDTVPLLTGVAIFFVLFYGVALRPL